MNIKEFLIDNYIWVLVIILITIVTIIGFFVDKSKSKKKGDTGATVPTPGPQMGPANGPVLNEQAPSLNQPVVNQPMGGAPTMGGQNMQQGMGFNVTSLSGLPQANNMPQDVNNVGNVNPQPAPASFGFGAPPVSNNDDLYQPLSEQKPHFEPVNPQVQTPVMMEQNTVPTTTPNAINVLPVQNNQQPTIPQPVMPQPAVLNNNVSDTMNNLVNNTQPMNNNPGFMSQPQVIPNPVGSNPLPGPIPNTQGNATIPTPINNQVNQGFVYNPQNNNQM